MSIEDQNNLFRNQKQSEQSNYQSIGSHNSRGFQWGHRGRSSQIRISEEPQFAQQSEFIAYEHQGAIINASGRNSQFQQNDQESEQPEQPEQQEEYKEARESLELVFEWNDQNNQNDLQDMIGRLSLGNPSDEGPNFKPDRPSLLPPKKQQVVNFQKKHQQGCICKKTQCLKLYCQCFQNGKLCTSICECVDCKNNMQNVEKLEEVKNHIQQKNPEAFISNTKEEAESLSEDNIKKKACNCKKSKCKKKYCECFNAGQKCNENCNCELCENQYIPKQHLLHNDDEKLEIENQAFQEMGGINLKKIKLNQ